MKRETGCEVTREAPDLTPSQLMDRMRRMVEYAALAPSTHNTQPWLFMLGSIGQDEIRLWADRSRWLRVVDPDRREMHLSVGCALENLLVAAEHFRLEATVQYFPQPTHEDFVARVRLAPGDGNSGNGRAGLARAMVVRHTSYERFDGRPIPCGVLVQFEKLAAEAPESDVRLIFRATREARLAVESLVRRADAVQFADPAFREELGRCIGRGAYGAPWLLAKLGQLAVSWLDLGDSAARRDGDVLMSSPLVAVVATTEDTMRARVRAGQVFERLHLTATMCGVSLQPMNQAVQVPELRGKILPAIAPEAVPGLHAQMLVRLGFARGPAAGPPRRPMDELLTADLLL